MPETSYFAPFPDEGILIPQRRPEPGTYDPLIAEGDIFFDRKRRAYVVRRKCDLCAKRNKACNRAASACKHCGALGLTCTWKEPRWFALPMHVVKADASPPKRKRKNEQADASPRVDKRRRPLDSVQFAVGQTQADHLRARVRLAHVTWDVVSPKPSAQPAPAALPRNPVVWASSVREFLEVVPILTICTPEGLVQGRDVLFLDADVPRQDGDGWSADGQSLTLTFTRTWNRPKGWFPGLPKVATTSASGLSHDRATSLPPSFHPKAGDRPNARAASVDSSAVPAPWLPIAELRLADVARAPSSAFDDLFGDEQAYRMTPPTAPEPLSIPFPEPYPTCVTSTPRARTTVFRPPFQRSEPPPPAPIDPDDLAFPDEIADLYDFGRMGAPLLLICSREWCAFDQPDAEVGVLGWFAVAQIEEEVLRGLGTFTGTARWRVQFAPQPQCALDVVPGVLNYMGPRDPVAGEPLGWRCACGRISARKWVHQYTCASCSNTRAAPLLDSRALRLPFAEGRPPIPDLEIASHSEGARPPAVSIFEDGSVVVAYVLDGGNDGALGRAYHTVNAEETRGARCHALFEEVQRAGLLERVAEDGMVGKMHVYMPSSWRSRDKSIGATFGFARGAAPDPLPTLTPLITRLLYLCDVDAHAGGARVMAGLMWLGPCKPMGIAFPPDARDVAVVALGANVLLSVPRAKRSGPRPRGDGTVTRTPECFSMLLHHADGAVLERLADAGHWEVRSENAAMLLISYSVGKSDSVFV